MKERIKASSPSYVRMLNASQHCNNNKQCTVNATSERS